jgi:hypothetical protein
MTEQRPGSPWRKSSYSDADGNGNCVEVAHQGEGVGLRDSKFPGGGTLRVTAAAWTAFRTTQDGSRLGG